LGFLIFSFSPFEQISFSKLVYRLALAKIKLSMASVFEINFNIMLKIKEKHFITMVLMLIWCVFPNKCESCNDLWWGKSKGLLGKYMARLKR